LVASSAHNEIGNRPGPEGDLQPERAKAGPRPSAVIRAFDRPNWLPIALIFGDPLVVVLSVVAAYWYRFEVQPQSSPLPESPNLGAYMVAIPIVVLLYAFALALNRQYTSWRGRSLVDQLFSMYSGIALAGMLILAAMSLSHIGFQYSRLALAYFLIISGVLMSLERYALRQYETRLRRQGIGTERVIMIGAGMASQMLIRRMTMFPQYGFHVEGVVDSELEVGSRFAGAPVLGAISKLPELIRRLDVHQVFLAIPNASDDELLSLIKLCENEKVEFKLVPDLLAIMSSPSAEVSIDGLPLIGIRRNQIRGRAAFLKRTIDLVVSALGSLLTLPVMACVALAIRLTSSGPVVFPQERVGLNGRSFKLYKFRSMIDDAEAKTGPVVTEPGDDRCTPVGRVLRRLSLDELPQLYNVLRGDMSLVGPRPMRPFLVDRYSEQLPRYLERHQVRPGLTGWAEVNDLRGAADIAERALYDLYYVENWSVVLDLKIIVLTALRIFFQRHAY
jgi:exopolysaccharide biosynthesis polyprenyl glycosylphosphotransferase